MSQNHRLSNAENPKPKPSFTRNGRPGHAKSRNIMMDRASGTLRKNNGKLNPSQRRRPGCHYYRRTSDNFWRPIDHRISRGPDGPFKRRQKKKKTNGDDQPLFHILMRKDHRPLQNAFLKRHNPFQEPHEKSQQAGQYIPFPAPGRQKHPPDHLPGEQ
jgi:hypothetical protein